MIARHFVQEPNCRFDFFNDYKDTWQWLRDCGDLVHANYLEKRYHLHLLIQALRSGEYQQGSGYLCENGRHCCLGVATEVAIKHGVSVSRGQRPHYPGIVSYDGAYLYVPVSVQAWYGFLDHSGERQSGAASMDVMNDSQEMTFDQIAAVLENNPGDFIRWPSVPSSN